MTTTGPFSRVQNSYPTWSKQQEWYRQEAPYKAPLPYWMRSVTASRPSDEKYGQNHQVAGNYSYDPIDSSPAYAEAYNKAYAKFKAACGEAASLAVNVAERKQAMDAMTKRVTQLVRFARALKRFDFGEAASALGLQVITQTRTTVRFKRTNKSKNSSWDRAVSKARSKPLVGSEDAPVSGQRHRKTFPRYRPEDDSWELRFKRRASAFGSNYLEFHFGWEPLMKDAQAAFNLFTDPMRDRLGLKTKGAATAVARSSGGNPAIWFNLSNQYYWKSRVSIRGRVKISNLNLYRLEQLGLLNPPVLLWELVPFSFIADWVFNVGDFLAGFSDFVGLAIEHPAVTHFLTHTDDRYYNYYGDLNHNSFMEHVCMRRSLGISGPILSLRPLKWPSVTRGLTAISLLTGLFGTVQLRR